MTIPHRFPSLIDGRAQVVLIAGSGLSTPNVPTVHALKGRLTEIAQSLGTSVDVSQDHDDYFYRLAEAVLGVLKDAGKKDSDSRVWFAEQLGILDSRRWFGEIGLPLSGNTPRHRALARFAVEKRLRAIVSLNWDTLLETALDSVGLADGPESLRPWDVTARATIIDDTHVPLLAAGNVFPVIKPHGCVRNLEKLRREGQLTGVIPPVTFKFTQSELASLPEGQTRVDKKVECYVSECPAIAIGWRATEDYLRNTIVATATAVQRTEQDAFTLIDLCWHQHHSEIANAYRQQPDDAFARVNEGSWPTTDNLLQWLQARYALTRLIAASTLPERAPLLKLLQELEQPIAGNPVVGWVDGWLHAWVRLCWRVGVMQGVDPHTGQKIEPYDIPAMPRDIHVPLGGMSTVRLDLQVAARVLIAISNNPGPIDFLLFPGGMWDANSGCLYLPLPGWRRRAQPAELAALKPFIEALRGRLGFVQTIKLIMLEVGDALPDEQLRLQLEAQVRRLMPATRFATGYGLSWVSLEALRGGSHAPVA